MAGHFTIDTDRGRGLLRVVMSGFYSPEDVKRYHAAVVAASSTLTQAPASQMMLCDISAMLIQSQEIVGAFREVMSDRRYARRRVGFVVGSTLARMQLLRIIGSRTAHVFTSTADAEAWLFDPDAQAA